MADRNDTQILSVPTEPPGRRGGPTWLVFGLVTGLLAVAFGAGLLWMQSSQAAQLDALQSSLADLDASMSGVEGNVAGLQASLTQAQTQLRELGGDVTSLDADIDAQRQATIDVGALSEQVLPSVVTVYCEDAFALSQGSGFAVEATELPSGYYSAVVTNHHVVADCIDNDDSVLWVSQGSARPTTRLAVWDEEQDLALLHVAEEFPPLAVGATPRVGDPVMSVGSPHGWDGTVVGGNVTNTDDSLLSHSASIGPGNSGGPLTDREGRVVGVNAGRFVDSNAQNFAIRMRVACQKILDCTED
jgi:S1-C subfamily serine protease